jgi:hypothetical protein
MFRTISAAVLSLLTAAFTADAQDGALAPAPVPAAAHAAPVAPVPFGPGERLAFRITLGPFGRVGHGSMEVIDLDTVHGHPSYELRLRIQGGIGFAKVDDSMASWLDASKLVSRRFHQDQKEIRYERHRKFDFFPEERRWARTDNDEKGDLPTDSPLDDLSFLYYVRTLPLEPGSTYTLDRYFSRKGNPVVVKVLRREEVKVPAGTFQTVVVQPLIQTRGLFSKGGKAEIYFTDDERRMVVQLKSSVPVVGSLNMYLESYSAGKQISPVVFAVPSTP